MTTPSSTNNYIQQSLNDIKQSFTDMNVKFDNFMASLPGTYVTIRNHELQIKAHEARIEDNAKRLDALETSWDTWKGSIGKWSLDQHDNMRKEWTGEVKDVNSKLDSVETSVIKMTEQQGHLSKVLTWVLYVFTGIMITIIGGLALAVMTHLIHF